MSQSPFRRSLQYIPPPLARAAARNRSGIPGLIRLHVSPSACGRRMSISAYREHTKDRLVHLYIDEEDIVSGCYEDLIPDAVEELLAVRRPRPRAIQIQVTCIDDLLGTDHAALRSLLEARFPDVRFCITRIDPIILDGGQPPAYEMMKQLYSLLSPTGRREDAVNLICDLPTLEWFRTQHPEIRVGDARRFDMREPNNDLGPCMAIGPSIGYLMGAPHVVEFPEPWAIYGYHGVELLMDKMFRAADTEADYARIRAESEIWQPVECRRGGCGI